MGVGPAVFSSAGKRSEHYLPGAYSRSAAVPAGGGGVSAGNGVILGKSTGGKPQTLRVYSTLAEAIDDLTDGELLEGVAHAFYPGGGYSPQSVRAMRVNPGTQSELQLLSGGSPVMILKSWDWGSHTNQLKMRLSAEQGGTFRADFMFRGVSETISNIGVRAFSLEYTGLGTTATLTIDGEQATFTSNVGGESFSVAFADFPTVGELVNRLNDSSVLLASFTGTDEAMPSTELDAVTDVSIIGSPPTSVENTKSITLAYTGIGIAVTATIAGGAFSVSSDVDGESFSVDLADYPTLSELVGYLNGTGYLAAAVTGADTGASSLNLTEVSNVALGADTVSFGGAKSFSIRYTGPGSDVGISITGTQMTITSGITEENITIPFASFPTLGTLVGQLNDTGFLAAVVYNSDSDASSLNLANGSVTIPSSTPALFASNFYALFHVLEQSLSVGPGNVEKPVGGENKMPDVSEFKYFTGGSAGTYTVADWNDALAVLEGEDIQVVSTPSTDPAVHALIKIHCETMSNVVNRRERTWFLGGDINETIEEALDRAHTLNSELGSYCYPSIKAISPLTGIAKTMPASYFACKCLGMEIAMSVNATLTWKSIDVLDWGKRLSTSAMERLIRGGVLVGGQTDDNRLAVMRSLTTYQGNKLQLCERSMVREDLYMNRDFRRIVSSGVGEPGVDVSGTSERTALMIAASDWRAQGLIIPDDEGNNVWGIVIRKTGDKTYITFNRYLVAPQNFFFITSNNMVYESQTTITV
ncbi:hypothetical protein FACS1894164_12250 [Spirochaetia bacterium]|nr:hypothetical protein FACS1894164_12250 [Spirochaetia bacterium]